MSASEMPIDGLNRVCQTVPIPTGPSVVFRASRMSVCHAGSLVTSATYANTSPTGRSITMLSDLSTTTGLLSSHPRQILITGMTGVDEDPTAWVLSESGCDKGSDQGSPAGQRESNRPNPNSARAFVGVADASAGRPSGAKVFGPFPQGFWVEGQDTAVSAYVEDLAENPEGWADIDTIPELVDSLATISR